MKSGTPSGKSANSSANKALGTPLPSTSRGLSPSSATHTSLSINGELPNAVAVGSNYYYSDDIWMTNDTGELLCSAKAASKHVFLDVLLPTGFLVPVQCPICRTFSQLKTDIYIQAKRYFVFTLLSFFFVLLAYSLDCQSVLELLTFPIIYLRQLAWTEYE